jgi:hypothetical protein
MDDTNKPADSANTADPWALSRRADEVLLKLLDRIERDIDSDRMVCQNPHVEAYEALCRAEAERTGIGARR